MGIPWVFLLLSVVIPSPFAITKVPAPTIFVVDALSSSSTRRPPRIRPGRQSPTAAPPDEMSYGGDGGERSKENSITSVNASDSSKNNSNSSNNKNDNNKHEQALRDPSLLTTIRFSDRTDLHPSTVEALTEGFGIRTMTVVQARTYEAARGGRSVLARSKTGSGKTLAFLLPVLERILDAEAGTEFRPGRSIGCVVLAPTRELAIQIADQAEILVRFHNQHRTAGRKDLRVACIYGECDRREGTPTETGGFDFESDLIREDRVGSRFEVMKSELTDYS